ncbi:intradiol ring-cleavage dioxygenase [Pseudonocardia sp. KRD291]|uniref:intradiol ring-cleavage dioxygenase n=1 Tax=Pseudonocardia sp. KRD291 TaxID=2792007 RepID=UPI001C4A115F|nr:intradiol ring-cleavage dioxygenase [Pseudonocardia sp. KRD291]MBW0106593.1 intradiol ring-cleavage dioxygenase [Pseudonocardia sp. KRD291]
MSSDDHDDHDDFGGISRDLPRLIGRRALLGLFAGAGAVALAGCASAATGGGAPPGGSGTQTAAGEIPEETGGPYPGDGSNGPNVLDDAGVVRRDIRSSFGTSTATAAGVPLTITLTVTDGGTPLAGAAVYLWHCDRDGRYSLYSEGIESENYLRGVQVADASGRLSFTSIYPACYDGRWPHIHFEVYSSQADATSSGNAVRTTQLALPRDVCETVYATPGYERSVSNLAKVTLDSDNVFGDGHDLQVAAVTGGVASGYAATLAVPV